ncbi:MAG: hypothetical protein M3Q42_13590 [Pseudomonadota bacterium]|nr:hypothetical protein [Pseudomonadota bacterium]
MNIQAPKGNSHCVFEYLYRDGGNWKTHGALLLTGEAGDAGTVIEQHCESDGLFVAEQVGIPSLSLEHFESCDEGPSNLDHAYHEFAGLRPATDEEVAALPVAGALDSLMARMQAAAGRWNVTLSPNCYL